LIRVLQGLAHLSDVRRHLLDDAGLAQRRSLDGGPGTGHGQEDDGQAAGDKELSEGHATSGFAKNKIDIVSWCRSY